MNTTTKQWYVAIAAGLGLALALGIGYWAGQRKPSAEPAAVASEDKSPKVLYWYDPMVPGERFDKPGKSPFMDMQLVPRYADPARSDGIRIAPGVRQNLGIRVAEVKVGPGVGDQIVAPGTLQWDLRGEQRISSRVEGFVDEVYVRAPFERVRAGQPLAAITAPRLATALAEYRALAESASADTRAVRAAANARLRVLGLSAADVRASAGGLPRVQLRAPADGVLAEILVRAGDTVMPGQPLFRLNTTDRIWLETKIPQASAAAIAPGAEVQVRVSTFPGEVFRGTVESLLPEVDAQTRTQTARIVLDNADGRLAAGMFAQAVLQTADTAPRPWIPSEALILTGRDARVIVRNQDGSFRPVRVRTGRQAAGRSEILDGLSGGERVVVSGQFLLDSEASLSGALDRLQGDAAQTPAPPPAPAETSTVEPSEAIPSEAEPSAHDHGDHP